MSAVTTYRRYLRVYRAFHRGMPWLWFGGCALCILVSMLGLGQRWLLAVCLLTIYPAIVGWLFLNGCGILALLLSRLGQRGLATKRSAWLVIATLFLVGTTFALGSLWLAVAVLRALITRG